MLTRLPSSRSKPPARAGCVRAFAAELDVVLRTLRRFGLGPADAEDVAQDVFLVMLRRWDELDPNRPVRPWLLGITHRVAVRHVRRARRETPSGFVDREDERFGPDDHASARGSRQLVVRALAELKSKHREILVLHELEGVPMVDIAQAHGVPLQTLYSRLKSARNAFGRVVRRLGRFPAGAAAVLPVSLVSLREAPAAPGLRERVLARIAARPVPAPSAWRLPARLRPRLVAAVFVAAAAAVVVLGVRVGPDRAAHADAPAWASVSSTAAPRVLALAPAARSRVLRPVPALAAAGAGPAGTRLAQALGVGLVGYWRFDEAAVGRGVRDFSGNGTDCLVRGPNDPTARAEGPHAGAGPLGSAFELDGRGFLECPRPQFAPEHPNQLSIALWVRPGPRGWYQTLVARQLGSARDDHFFLGLVEDRLLFESHVSGGRILGPALPVGVWTHVAVVWRDGTTTLHVDGVEVGRAAGARVPRLELASPLLIGASRDGPAGAQAKLRFRGAIDELVVHGRALEPDEVVALAGGTQPLLSP